MNVSLTNLLYLAFRLAPFILICYYLVSTIFMQEIQSVLFLIGLLVACVASIVIGNTFSFFKFEMRDYGPDTESMCHTLSSTGKGTVSLLPLSTVIYTYALSYLGIPILHSRRNNANMPILVFFPIITFIDICWNYMFGCSTLWNLFGAGVVGMTIGLSWSEIIYNSSFKLNQSDSILTESDVCSMNTATGFKCVQRSKEPTDPVEDVSGDITNNMMLASYRYLTNMYKEDVDYLRRNVKAEINILNNELKKVETSAGIVATPNPGYVIMVNTDAESPGIDYKYTNGMHDQTSCKDICDASLNQCVGFTYDSSTKKCVFKSSIALPAPSESKSYFVPMKTGSLYFPSTHYASDSNTITTLSGITDPSVCVDRCLTDTRCVGVQYESGKTQCALLRNLNTAGPYYDDGAQFFLKTADISNDIYDVYPNIQFTGGITSIKTKMTNPTQCYSLCTKDEYCAGFNYNSTTKTCMLHDSNSVYNSATFDVSYNSYIKTSTAPEDTYKYAFNAE